MELLREHRLSKGKAAEILGIDRHELFDLMTNYRVPVINLDTEELGNELRKPLTGHNDGATMIIVADSGPIISFARAGRLDLLKQVTTELIIPNAVFEELVASGDDRAGAEEVKQGLWIKQYLETVFISSSSERWEKRKKSRRSNKK
jgi:hypothetical protein